MSENPVSVRVKFEIQMWDMLPEVLAVEYRYRGDDAEAGRLEEKADQCKREAILLERIVELPAVPRVGDVVLVNQNWEPVFVSDVLWDLDPDGDDPFVTVVLAPLDEDQFSGSSPLESMLDFGWAVKLEGFGG